MTVLMLREEMKKFVTLTQKPEEVKKAVEEEKPVQAYSAANDMLSTAEKMESLLETLPEVEAFLGLGP